MFIYIYITSVSSISPVSSSKERMRSKRLFLIMAVVLHSVIAFKFIGGN